MQAILKIVEIIMQKSSEILQMQARYKCALEDDQFLKTSNTLGHYSELH